MKPRFTVVAASLAALAMVAVSPDAPASERPHARQQVAALPAGASVTADNVEALLREMGFAPQRIVRDEVVVLVFEIEKRQVLMLWGGCAGGGCNNLQIRAAFTTPRRTALDTIAAWNRGGTPLTALIDVDGDPTAVSDVVLDGASIATIRAWIEIWREQLPRFLAHLAK